MQHKTKLLLICTLLLAGPAGARVYQCTDTSGAVTFQDLPCGQDSVAVLKRTPAASSGLRASEQRWLREREKRAPRKVRAAPQRGNARSSAKKQEQRCWKKQQQLDEVRAKLRRGYKPSQGERLRRKRRSLDDYLSRYCG